MCHQNIMLASTYTFGHTLSVHLVKANFSSILPKFERMMTRFFGFLKLLNSMAIE